MILVMMQTTEYEGGQERKELDRLLADVARGDQDALAGLYHRTRAAVYAMVLSILKNTHDAQDVKPEDRQLLQTALAALSQTERQVVLLHAVTGLKHREIAEILELPLATVLSKYRRALRKLKEWMEGDDAL
ncbi:MAG: hypothetical protein IKU81_08835 [Oscillibacter sp.]|nr:hypothetical protein [Oscillibacter sp.]